jgi:hypothetical protein
MSASVLVVLLGGCASAVPVVDFYDTDSRTLLRFQQITIVSESQGLKNLGEVVLAETQAIDQVKLKAAEKGADHIDAPQCEIRDSGDFTNNCYGTVVCTASAYK